MVFSLFGRKDKPEARRPRDTRVPVGAGGESTMPVPATRPSPELQRQMAQATARKIDQIEAEILDGRAPSTPGPARPAGPALGPLHPASRPGSRGENTSVVLGDTAGAFAIDVDGSALPPMLEEAAILFANGQSEPAAATLRQAIAGQDLGPNLVVAWWMLLDVMQASGQRAEFDSLALDFASRFQQDPPAWRDELAPSVVARPAAAGLPPKPTAAATPVPAAPAAPPGTIVLAGALDVGVVRAIEALQALAADPAATPTLDFGRAASVDAAGAALLMKTFQAFKASGRALQVSGATRLLEVSQAAIAPGRRDDADTCWWLALETLRLLDRRQAFEDLAIDYCVTYEVSPPSWEPMPPCVRPHDLGPVAPLAADAPATAAPAAPVASSPAAPVAPPSVPEGAFPLRGDLVGRLGPVSRAMREAVAERNDLVIDCRSLRRVDFVAAGELLNEVAAIRTAQKTVLFAEPTAIVHALFIVMGIHDLAEIRRRRH